MRGRYTKMIQANLIGFLTHSVMVDAHFYNVTVLFIVTASFVLSFVRVKNSTKLN